MAQRRPVPWLLALCSALAFPTAALGQPCPPIPAGTDVFPSTGKLVLDFAATASLPPEVVRLSSEGLGNTVVHRSAQVGDTIATELLEIELTGQSLQLGAVRLRLGSSGPSLGRIEGVKQHPLTCALTQGDSFFDVFVELDVPSRGETWLNVEAFRIQRVIHELPPFDEPYESPLPAAVTLVDAATGGFRATLRYDLLHADPLFPAGGLDAFDTDIVHGITLFDIGYTAHLSARGPLTVLRGDPQRDPTTGVQFFDTEILELALTGSDQVLGQFLLTAKPAISSTGQTRSVSPSPTYPAEGFFDVFFDLSTQNQRSYTTLEPTRILATLDNGNPIRNTPPHPGTHFLSPPGASTPLFDENGQVAGELFELDHVLGGYRSAGPMPAGGESCAGTSWDMKVTILDASGGCTEAMRLEGPYRHLRGNPVVPGNGLDLVQWLLAKVAASPPAIDTNCLGSVTLRLSQTNASTGQVQSLAPRENFPAASFFDVWAVLDTSNLGRLSSGAASHLETTINDLPPELGETFFGNGQTVPLMDASGTLVGSASIEKLRVGDPGRCPFEDEPQLTILPDKATIAASSKGSGAGLQYDLVRGQFGPASTLNWVTSLQLATCLQDNGPNSFVDTANPPLREMYWYLWRDGYDTGQGTWNDPFVALDRDSLITACP